MKLPVKNGSDVTGRVSLVSGISKIRIIFFIGGLPVGGKERRLIELLTYLRGKEGFELMVVFTRDCIQFDNFYRLDIPYKVIEKEGLNKYSAIVYGFYKICKEFKPHFVHSWGRMQTFYTLPAVIGQGIFLVNSQITSAPPKSSFWTINSIIDRINFLFSKVILSNSKAGIESYRPSAKKSKVIYNGINPCRLTNLPDIEQVKAKYGIRTPYVVIMAATFSQNKDWDLFLKVAKMVVGVRDDITFLGVGGYHMDDTIYLRILSKSGNNDRILFPGKINDVESVVNACTIGVLFSNKLVHGEGISNSVLEYMALGKPVIANDTGGTVEIVHHGRNGYLITHQTEDEIAGLIIDLIDDKQKCEEFGRESRKIIDASFSLDQMGRAFEQVYKELVPASQIYAVQNSV